MPRCAGGQVRRPSDKGVGERSGEHVASNGTMSERRA